MSRAAFLFGSGISIPSGTPSVQEITRALLKLGWRERGKFRFTPSDAESAGTTKLAQEFLRVLKTFLDPHLKIRLNRECNYEDLFAAASQILCDEAGDIVDPMLCESVRAIRNSVSHLCSASEIEGRSDPFLSLVEQAALFVHAGVFHLIGTATRPLGMDALVAVARYTEQMDIFTVNHDLLIETLFDENGVRFSDGYSKNAGPVRRFKLVLEKRSTCPNLQTTWLDRLFPIPFPRYISPVCQGSEERPVAKLQRGRRQWTSPRQRSPVAAHRHNRKGAAIWCGYLKRVPS